MEPKKLTVLEFVSGFARLTISTIFEVTGTALESAGSAFGRVSLRIMSSRDAWAFEERFRYTLDGKLDPEWCYECHESKNEYCRNGHSWFSPDVRDHFRKIREGFRPLESNGDIEQARESYRGPFTGLRIPGTNPPWGTDSEVRKAPWPDKPLTEVLDEAEAADPELRALNEATARVLRDAITQELTRPRLDSWVGWWTCECGQHLPTCAVGCPCGRQLAPGRIETIPADPSICPHCGEPKQFCTRRRGPAIPPSERDAIIAERMAETLPERRGRIAQQQATASAFLRAFGLHARAEVAAADRITGRAR